MPLYDYRCTSCGDFREFRPMAESRASRACPVCGTLSERLISTPFLADKESSGASGHPHGGQTGVPHICGHGHGCSHSHGA